ncbi:Protein of unknown function [Gryllus bimaculatus]|nr:Protein of unknown function [Gryllus bimaculatus]
MMRALSALEPGLTMGPAGAREGPAPPPPGLITSQERRCGNGSSPCTAEQDLKLWRDVVEGSDNSRARRNASAGGDGCGDGRDTRSRPAAVSLPLLATTFGDWGAVCDLKCRRHGPRRVRPFRD